MNNVTLNEEQIRETAYGFWLEEGQPQGRNEEHWLRAIDALNAPVAKKAKPARKAAAKPRAASAATKKTAKPRAKTAKK